MRTRYPELFQFFAGYFNQDWNCDYETADDVIRAFVADSSTETLFRVKRELQTVLRTIQSEEELHEFLFGEIGCSYYYPHAWQSGRAWLEHVLGML